MDRTLLHWLFSLVDTYWSKIINKLMSLKRKTHEYDWVLNLCALYAIIYCIWLPTSSETIPVLGFSGVKLYFLLLSSVTFMTVSEGFNILM